MKGVYEEWVSRGCLKANSVIERKCAMDIKKLESNIQYGDICEAINIIDEIGRKKIREASPFLIKQLESTDNHILRDSIALALSDVGDKEAVKPIINLLNDPKTKGHRGTLLAALEPFDYSEYIDMLVNFLYEDSFEVSRKSLILIEATINDMPNEIKEKYIAEINTKLDKLEEKIDFLTEAVDVFTNKRSF